MADHVVILAASGSGGGSGTFTIIILVALVAFFYFAVIRPGKRRRQQQQELQNQLVQGSRVLTTAGMFATVAEIDGSEVVLELSDGVRARFLRQAIRQVLPDDEPSPGADGTDEVDTASAGDLESPAGAQPAAGGAHPDAADDDDAAEPAGQAATVAAERDGSSR